MGRSSVRHLARRLMLLGAATLVCPTAGAARPAAAATTSRSAPEPKDAIDPDVMAVFDKMGVFLRSLPFIHVTAETTTDEVTETGQKVQFGGTVQFHAQRPNRLRVDISADRMKRQLFYDGRTFTQYDTETGFYASFDAPPTTGELIETLERHYAIEVPLVDLLYWGTERFDVEEIRSAVFIGKSSVSDVPCDHFAFRQKDVDWQVWVTPGARPWPLKIVITTTSVPAQPQHSSVLNWDLSTKLVDSAYEFVPPAGSHRIEFETVK
jgi:hypothetical protein